MQEHVPIFAIFFLFLSVRKNIFVNYLHNSNIFCIFAVRIVLSVILKGGIFNIDE